MLATGHIENLLMSKLCISMKILKILTNWPSLDYETLGTIVSDLANARITPIFLQSANICHEVVNCNNLYLTTHTIF